jgi:hypothetical protein
MEVVFNAIIYVKHVNRLGNVLNVNTYYLIIIIVVHANRKINQWLMINVKVYVEMGWLIKKRKNVMIAINWMVMGIIFYIILVVLNYAELKNQE